VGKLIHRTVWAALFLAAAAGCGSSDSDGGVETLMDDSLNQGPNSTATTAATTPLMPAAEPDATSSVAGARTATGRLTAQTPPAPSGMDRYPRRPDGTPDFEKYLLDSMRQGVTSENNAAVVLWQVTGMPQPTDLSREIGLSGPPPRDDHLGVLWGNERLEQWLRQRGRVVPNSGEMTKIVGAAMAHPWTSQSPPPLTEWLHKNEAPLARVVAATRRSRFYWPNPGLLDEADDSLVDRVTGDVAVRHSIATQSLRAAAMGCLGEGRTYDAWQYILAAFHLNRLISVNEGLVGQGLVLAKDGDACQSLYALLDHRALSADQARDVLQDVSALSKFSMADSLDTIERAMCLDVALRVKTGRISARLKTALEQGRPPGHVDQLTAAAGEMADYNAVLKRCNEFYDRFVVIMRMPPGPQRQQAFIQIRSDAGEYGLGNTDAPSRLLPHVFAQLSEPERVDVVSSVIISWFFRDIRRFVPIIGEDDAHTRIELSRLAAALAAYRAEHGEYPIELDDLVPHVLDKLPVDSHHAKPFRYRREGTGYFLYGLGANGVDDAGSTGHAFQFVFEGRPLDEMSAAESRTARQKIPRGADDWSIRLPRLAFEWASLLSTE
jgi:hypothetical protein